MIALRVLSGVAGGLLLCFILFSYEDEEKRVQNWLEQAWQARDDTRFLHPVRQSFYSDLRANDMHRNRS